MDPILGGALIGGGSALLGGLFSNSAAKKAAQINARAQREFAQHGVRWRVEDAKQAGLHPLYALGAQVPSFTPVQYQDALGPALAEAGQGVGRAIAAQQTPSERAMTMLQLGQAQKGIEESDMRIALMRSEIARNRLAMLGSMGVPSANQGFDPSSPVPEGQVPNHALQGQVVVKPSEVSTSSGVPGIQAGIPAGFRLYSMPYGPNVLLPSEDMSESLESAGEVISPLVVLAANLSYYNHSLAKWEREQLKAVIDRWAEARAKNDQSRKPLDSRAGNLWRR